MSRPTSELKSAHSKFIQAGAGAGKTTLLIKSFFEFAVDFKKTNGRWPRVILTTFTRKATQEIKERLLLKAIQDGQSELFEFINKKSYVHISTIHSVLSLLISEAYASVGLPAQVKVVDDQQQTKTQKKILNSILKTKTEYISLLENFPLSTLLSITQKLLNLRMQFSDIKAVCAKVLLDLSEKKRADLIQQLDQLFQQVQPWPEIWSNYAAYLNQVRQSLSAPITTETIEFLSDKSRKPKKPDKRNKNYTLTAEQAELITDIEDDLKLKMGDSVDFIEIFSGVTQLLDQFVLHFEQQMNEHKNKTGEITISDLENIASAILLKDPNAFQHFSKNWDFFMVDEFQDTSPLQVKLLEAMVQDKPSFVVGDPQQSIYLFRGARAEVFGQKKSKSETEKIDIVDLNRNYRTRPTLMKVVNHLVTQMGPQFRSMDLKEAQAADSVDVADCYFITSENQVQATLEQINYFLSKGISPQSICVLSRSKKNLNQLAEQAFRKGVSVQLNISAGFEKKREVQDIVSFLKFLVNPHDNINLVTVLRSPWFYMPDQQLYNIFQLSKDKSHWQKLLKDYSGEAAIQALKSSIEIYESAGASRALRHLAFTRGMIETSLFADASGTREANIVKLIKDLNDAEKSVGFNLIQFVTNYFSAVGDDFSSSESDAVPVVVPDSVSLMTIHASKGLEFDHVVLLGLNELPNNTKSEDLYFDPETKVYSPTLKIEDSISPNTNWGELERKKMVEREQSEFDRLFYVAATRAKTSLSLVAQFKKNKKSDAPVSKNSWLSKLNWPTTTDAFAAVAPESKIEIRKSESEVEDKKIEFKKVDFVRPRLQFVQDQKPESLSVTAVLDSETAGQASPQQMQQQLKNLQLAHLGTKAHMVFEALKYSDAAILDRALTTDIRAMVDFLMKNTEMDFKKIIDVGHSEWGFGLKVKDSKLIGQIDLWAELDDVIHIVDYKTGRPEYAEKAFKQLSIYAAALGKMKQISLNKKIQLSAVYVTDQKIISKSYQHLADLQHSQKEVLNWLD